MTKFSIFQKKISFNGNASPEIETLPRFSKSSVRALTDKVLW